MCAFWVTAFRERYGSDNQNNITIIIVKREWQHGIAVQSNAASDLPDPPPLGQGGLGAVYQAEASMMPGLSHAGPPASSNLVTITACN